MLFMKKIAIAATGAALLTIGATGGANAATFTEVEGLAGNNTFATANDINGSFTVSPFNPLKKSVTITGNRIDPIANSADFFKFTVNAGEQLIANLTSADFPPPNLRLGLFGPGGAFITEVTSPPAGFAGPLTYSVLTSGDYALAITDFGDTNYTGGGDVGYEYGSVLVDIKPVPEPASTLGILAFGALGGGSLLKRKKKQAAEV